MVFEKSFKHFNLFLMIFRFLHFVFRATVSKL